MSADPAAEAPRDNSGNEPAVTPRSVDWNNPRVSAILSAAAKCFARKGFTATTLAEIGRELGLRKSIVHYYFASKGALIHEVQSFTYNKYLQRVREALAGSSATTKEERAMDALRSLWEVRGGTSNTGLNIEVWSASRNDPELKRRAAALAGEKKRLIIEGVTDTLGPDATKLVRLEALATLILAVLDGLSVAAYIEGDESKTNEAYRLFLYLLRLGIEALGGSNGSGQASGA